jgi:branched-chain amino acid transport system ATP-binding protein
MGLLDIRNLHVHYGNIHALRGVSLAVGEQQIVTLIGANGAGKTTTLRAISGIIAASEGEVAFDGERLNALAAHAIVAKGVVHVPEGRRIFSRLTVAENLRIGAFLSKDKRWIGERETHALQMFPVLKERLRQVAGTLSGGEQQMLSMGRALATDPGVLLIDELSMGLAPLIVEELYDHVRRIAASGLSILIVEQFAHEILGVADLAGIMLHGNIVETGTPAQIADDLTSAYLGGTHH